VQINGLLNYSCQAGEASSGAAASVEIAKKSIFADDSRQSEFSRRPRSVFRVLLRNIAGKQK